MTKKIFLAFAISVISPNLLALAGESEAIQSRILVKQEKIVALLEEISKKLDQKSNDIFCKCKGQKLIRVSEMNGTYKENELSEYVITGQCQEELRRHPACEK